ncbi:hypothetical protein VAR608DRAFT_5753 [Variovorax sp. HW608]|uniref:hypothetical protein n=1 Tax=Variovorax sp. HW608 TaxID=1034889 RepID=UPI0008201395|nr:hypothetical protein [Variovorax sp. HW608]SCK55696.1 hypothetical protein VAR608DRAFT_5753 [Variovorax sp. HW608]
MNQLNTDAAAIDAAGSDKPAVLAKLLQHGAEGEESLTRITGWPVEVTRHALLQLIVAGKVRCLRSGGGLRYGLRDAPLGERRR